MNARLSLRLLAALIGACGTATTAAPAAPLVMLVETSALMPQARIEGGRVVEGLHVDLGLALARRLDRTLVLRPTPRKRLAQALERGEGDMLCDYQSDWLPGSFAWSRPFIPDQALLVATHRHNMLSILNRLIVIDGGKVIADGPRDEVLKHLSAAAAMPRQGQQP